MKQPLEGVTVLSLAEQLPGPYATLLMADLGANVIQVERPVTGDPARAFPEFFAAVSRNKRSVCLDLKSPVDHNRFLELVKTADVVLEGYSPGTVARLGIDYETLRRIKSDLIYASISGFGQYGPYRDRPAHDISYQSVAGLLADDAREPGKAPTLPIGDMSSAVFAAYSVVCALFSRERTGAGTYIDVSVSDCLVSLISPLLVPAMNGAPTLSFLKSPAYGMFACADGKTLTLSIAHEDHFWKILCEALDLDNFSDLTHSERVHESEKLRSIIARIISREPLSKWSDMFVGKGIPWGPINTLEDVANDPHFKSRGVYELIENADGVSEFHVRQPVKFSAYPERALTRPPGLGEHNREIFRNTNEK